MSSVSELLELHDGARVISAFCEKHGEFQKVVVRLGKKDMAMNACPKCLESSQSEAERIRQEKEEEINARYLESAIRSLSIPRRYQDACVESYTPVCEASSKAKRWTQAYIERFDTVLDKGTSMVLCGKPGTGKTHLATAIAKYVVQNYQAKLRPLDMEVYFKDVMKPFPPVVVEMVTALDILRDVKGTYGGGGNERDVIGRYASIPLLVIDEVGVHYGTDADKIILFDLLNQRYQEMLPTILISNLPIDELGGFIGERVLDRLKENGGAVIDFTWESYRSNGGVA